MYNIIRITIFADNKLLVQEKKIKQIHDKLYWVGYKAYSVDKDIISISAGGVEEQEDIDKLRKYLKRKKLI